MKSAYPFGTALVTAAFLATSAGAATVQGYTSFFAFGDSLSDNGNLFAATGGTIPVSPPYFQGRFSNGPVWAEPVAATFTAQGLATANFAFGGAQAVQNGDMIPDLTTQLGIFAASVPAAALGSKPLASLWFGSNDLFAAIGTLTTDEVRAAGRAAADAVGAGALALAGAGIRDLVVFSLPDFGLLPSYALFQPVDVADATAGTDAFNAQLDAQIDLLRITGLNVIEIDIKGLFDALVADPTQFGVANATLPCLIPNVSLCSPLQAQALAFFDPVHPNAVIHGAIAGIVTEALAPAPVPLPLPGALLAFALAALGNSARRRRASNQDRSIAV